MGCVTREGTSCSVVRRLAWVAAAAAALGLGAGSPAGAVPGALDPSFGHQGLVRVQPAELFDNHPDDVFVQPDGTLVVPTYFDDVAEGPITTMLASDPAGAVLAARSAVDFYFSVTDSARAGTDRFVLTDGYSVTRVLLDGSRDPGVPAWLAPEVGEGQSLSAVAAGADLSFILGVDSAVGGDLRVIRLRPDGTPDTAFGQGGTATLDVGGAEHVSEVLVQPDGAVVVAGSTTRGGRTDAVIARFTASGVPDTGFGTGGFRRVDLGGTDTTVTAVRLRSGALVAAGASDGKQALFRVTANGALDTAFGTGGRRVYGSLPEPTDLALLGSGRLATAGSGLSDEIAVARFHADGRPDSAFSGDGVASTTMTGVDNASGLAVQPDGRLVVSLDGARLGVTLARFTSAGTLDAPFGVGGVARGYAGSAGQELHAVVSDGAGGFVTAGHYWLSAYGFNWPSSLLARHTARGRAVTAFGAQLGHASHSGLQQTLAMARHGDGRLVVVGDWGPGPWPDSYDPEQAVFSVGRMAASGAVDTSFVPADTMHTFRLPFPSRATAVVVRADGGIVAAGQRADGAAVVVRLLPSGTPDPSFSGDGIAVFPRLTQPSGLRSLPDGKVLVAGTRAGDLSVMRLTAAGGLDPGFSGDGFAIVDAGGNDRATGLSLDRSGRILVSASSGTAGGSAAVVVRWSASGVVDRSFSGDGVTKLAAGAAAQARAIELQADGRIIVTGVAGGRLMVARLRPGGTLDGTFAGDGIVVSTLVGAGEALLVEGNRRAIVAGQSGRDGLVASYLLR